MSRELLQLEVRFLVARHGYRAVLEALGQLRCATVDELETEIGKLEEKKRRKRKSKTVDELVADAEGKRPDAAPAIRSLVARYEGKTFLPELKDAKRFLARHGHAGAFPKSRKAALPKIIGKLCELPAEQLTELLHDAGGTEATSDYSLLTREILGAGATKEEEAESDH